MQELLEDINALRRGIEALNKRSVEQGKPVSRAELEEALAHVQAAVKAQPQPNITLDVERVAQRIQGHLATPAAIGAVLSTGTEQLKVVVDRLPRSVAIEGEVMGFTNWRAAGLVALVPVLLLLIGQAFGGMFSRVSQEKYDNLLRAAQAVGAERDYYQGQIQQFHKNMGTTKALRELTQQSFPPYIPPAAAKTN